MAVKYASIAVKFLDVIRILIPNIHFNYVSKL